MFYYEGKYFPNAVRNFTTNLVEDPDDKNAAIVVLSWVPPSQDGLLNNSYYEVKVSSVVIGDHQHCRDYPEKTLVLPKVCSAVLLF